MVGQPSKARYKARKKKEAASRLNLDNALPHQIGAVLAERDKLIANAEKRLPKKLAALYAKQNGGGIK